jgi:hypothetical protein
MPVFIAAIGGMLINLVGTLVGRVMVALGISVITYTGMSTTLSTLKQQAITSFQGLPADLLGMLSYMRVGQAFSIVTSAIVARMVINGVSGDSFKRWVNK